jgi:hypothetical protein
MALEIAMQQRAAVTISLYTVACGESWRKKYRQCRSDQSIIGAVHRRCETVFMAAILSGRLGRCDSGNRPRRRLACSLA